MANSMKRSASPQTRKTNNQADEHPERLDWPVMAGTTDDYDAMMARYRRLRGLPDNGSAYSTHREAQDLAIPSSPPPRRSGTAIKQRQEAGLPKTYLLAVIAAVIAGGTTGYVAAQFGKAPDTSLQQAAEHREGEPLPALTLAGEATQPAAATIRLPKKSVPMATLQVADAQGAINSHIPLAMSAEPAFAGQDIILKISGLPPHAYLTAGARQADNAWQLLPRDIEDLKLVVTGTSDRTIGLSVAAIETATGELVSPVKEMTVALDDAPPLIQPAAAPPHTAVPAITDDMEAGQPAAVPLPAAGVAALLAIQESVQSLITEGEAALASGDVGRARQNFRQALDLGAREGAMGLARSHDPEVIARRKLPPSVADATEALEWYRRAQSSGMTEAGAVVARLTHP